MFAMSLRSNPLSSIRLAARCAVAAAALLLTTQASAQSTVVTLENGPEGWDGNAPIEPTGGNPGANAHFLIESFGIRYSTESHPAFIGNMTLSPSITVGVDAVADSITYLGNEVSRDVVVEFRSRALAQNGYPWTSVWFNLGTIAAGTPWQSLSVTVTPNSATLPAGWGGYGDEDPNTFEPRLPPGVTFADVMATVDEVEFTTFVPGMFYGFTIFDARFDNFRIERALGDAIFANGFEPEL